MLIVGELINASRKSIAEAIEAGDASAIENLARDQAAAGADFIDVNAGTFVGREAEYLQWLVQRVQSVVDVPCCIDSPDPTSIEAAMAVHRGRAMINSISMEKKRLDALLPLLAGTDLKVVALCMGDGGMPETVEDRMEIADRLVNRLLQNNVPLENIYVDPLVQPIATNSGYGPAFLDAIGQIREKFTGVHTLCGMSNVSFGLPRRAFLNQAFMVMAIGRGLDGAIVNPLDRRMMALITAAQTLTGNDDYCMNYLGDFRSGKIPD